MSNSKSDTPDAELKTVVCEMNLEGAFDERESSLKDGLAFGSMNEDETIAEARLPYDEPSHDPVALENSEFDQTKRLDPHVLPDRMNSALKSKTISLSVNDMLNGSLFRSKSEVIQYRAISPALLSRFGSGHRTISWIRIAVAVLILAFIGASSSLLVIEKARRDRLAIATSIQDIHDFIRLGSFGQLRQEIEEGYDTGMFNKANAELHSLAVRADATLYRYYDADPIRLTRIEQAISDGTVERYDLVIAKALSRSRAEQIVLFSDISNSSKHEKADPQSAFLRGRLHISLSPSISVEEAIEPSYRIEPSNLAHLLFSAESHHRAGEEFASQSVVDQMTDISPKSPWTILAKWTVDGNKEDQPTMSEEMKLLVDEWPPVLRAQAYQKEALRLAVAGHDLQSKKALKKAIEAIGSEPSFLIDFADQLLTHRQANLAAVTVSSEKWPEESDAAKSIIGRLATQQGRFQEALDIFSRNPDVVRKFPRAARSFSTATTALKQHEKSVAILEQLKSQWPTVVEYRRAYAKAVVRTGAYELALSEIAELLKKAKATKNKNLEYEFTVLKGEIYLQQGELGPALRTANAAAKLVPKGELHGPLQRNVMVLQSAVEQPTKERQRRRIRRRRKSRRGKKRPRRHKR
jgi:tetratricopeptide (TPR) repeat protein